MTAAAPVQLLDLGWSSTFTSPQTTENEMPMLSLNGSVKATSTLTFSGVGYYRWFKQKHVDGNIAERAVPCDRGSARRCVCLETRRAARRDANGDYDAVRRRHRATARSTAPARTRQATAAHCRQSRNARFSACRNQFLIGASYDHGNVNYSANSELGFFAPKFVVNGFAASVLLGGTPD